MLMTAYKFTVDGPPVGKGRPRVTKNGTYTPKKTKQYEKNVRACYDGPFFTGPLSITITAYFQIQKSGSKQLKLDKVKGLIRPTIKPDYDNIGKAICDSLNEIAWKDDSQIVEAIIRKYYSDTARVEIEIRGEIEKEKE